MGEAALQTQHLPRFDDLGSEIGFEYRTGEEIDRRRRLQEVFEKVARRAESRILELPLASPVTDFVGKPPRPLTERHLQRLFSSILPEGIPCAVRYEGTVLTAKYVARLLRSGNAIDSARFHYFQEMLRVELAEDLDESHFRSFYQAGVEFFARTDREHRRNIIELVAVLVDFLCSLGLEPLIRFSHVELLQGPLRALNLAEHDRRRILGFMERGDIASLTRLMNVLDSSGDVADLLIALARRGQMSMEEGIGVLKNYSGFYPKALPSLEQLESGLRSRHLSEFCRLDPGIHRSLDFYAGITLQADAGGVRECAGGGEYTGLVETFGTPGPIHSVGFACGVERLLNALTERK